MRALRSFVERLGRAIVLGAGVLLSGCAVLGGSDGDQRTVIVYPGGDTSQDPVILPASELPPAGKCRLWYQDRAPEDQPESGDCEELGKEVPAGAVLVRG